MAHRMDVVKRSGGDPSTIDDTTNDAPVQVDSTNSNQLKWRAGSSATGTVYTVVDNTNDQSIAGKKTFTGGIVRPSEVVSAVNVLTAAESGKTFFLNSATEFATTLPAPAAGVEFTFIVSAAPSGASYTVVTEGGCQILAGHVLTSGFADSGSDVETTATGTTITFVDGVSVVGDRAHVISDGTSWFASCITAVEAGITITG